MIPINLVTYMLKTNTISILTLKRVVKGGERESRFPNGKKLRITDHRY